MGIYIPNTFDVSGNADVLGGSGGGGTGPSPTGTTISWDLQEFSTSGTYNKPNQAIYIEVVGVGAGGGSSSGARRATGTAAPAGPAGGMGILGWGSLNASQCPDVVPITIGAGGGGGAAVTADDTNGTGGGAGGGCGFGNIFSFAGGGGSLANIGGTGAISTNISSLYFFRPIPFADAGRVDSASSGAGTNIAPTQASAYTYQRRHSNIGGGITNLNVENVGSPGSRLYTSLKVLSAAATGGTVPGGNGGNGINNYQDLMSVSPAMLASGNPGTLHIGTSGAGGASSISTAGGDAGAPGDYGVGGAGGGASRNGNNSGAGGAGSGGFIKVLTLYLT